MQRTCRVGVNGTAGAIVVRACPLLAPRGLSQNPPRVVWFVAGACVQPVTQGTGKALTASDDCEPWGSSRCGGCATLATRASHEGRPPQPGIWWLCLVERLPQGFLKNDCSRWTWLAVPRHRGYTQKAVKRVAMLSDRELVPSHGSELRRCICEALPVG